MDYKEIEGDGGGRGQKDFTLTVTLTPSSITSDFGNILYRPWDSFTGFDQIHISVSDNGNTGYNPVASDRETDNLPYILRDTLTLPMNVLNRQDELHVLFLTG